MLNSPSTSEKPHGSKKKSKKGNVSSCHPMIRQQQLQLKVAQQQQQPVTAQPIQQSTLVMKMQQLIVAAQKQ
jgi:hypothetical protein